VTCVFERASSPRGFVVLYGRDKLCDYTISFILVKVTLHVKELAFLERHAAFCRVF